MTLRSALRLALALAVLLGAGTAPSVTPALAADPVSGTVSGTVFNDFNGNGQMDRTSGIGVAVDVGIAGIRVRAYDTEGALVGETTSGSDGNFLLDINDSASTRVRIEFTIPDVATAPALAGFEPSAAYWGPPEPTDPVSPRSAGSIRFVDIEAPVSSIDFAVLRPNDYCDDPTLVTCLLPIGDDEGQAVPGLVEFSADAMVPTFASNALTYTGAGFQASSITLGSVFGIGIDRSGRSVDGVRVVAPNAFVGSYVKRHSEYGSAGNTNTIYRVPLLAAGGSAASVFVTLPSVDGRPLPLHDPSVGTGALATIRYSDDRAIFRHVGRIGLGDVDVTDDGETLLAVGMDETDPRLFFIPLIRSGAAVTPGPFTSLPIPRPSTFAGVDCQGLWHPMGIGTRGGRILIGGVCGAEDTVTPTSPRGDVPTKAAAFVLEYTGSRDASGNFSTVFGLRMDYDRGCGSTVLGCSNTGSTTGSPMSADWTAWNDFPNWVRNDNNNRWLATNPQPMLSNIEITDSGDLILAFRDRFTDQQSPGMMPWTEAANDDDDDYDAPTDFNLGETANVFATGDILRVCASGGTMTLEANGTCPNLLGSEAPDFTGPPSGRLEFYWDNFPHFASIRNSDAGTQHPETANGSTATLPGWTGVWSTAYDIDFVNQQGVLVFGQCSDMADPTKCLPDTKLAAGFPNAGYGNRLGGIRFPRDPSVLPWLSAPTFEKGNGLADLELVCDQAPLQIGNRVWIDLNGDGIQDPDEPSVAGVTVRLYDANGVLVGTAITGPDGEYFFSSASGEAADGGATPDAFGGGLAPGATFTVRLDERSDYAEGGPLHGYVVTITASTVSVVSGVTGGLDSDATLNAAGFPIIAIPALRSGTFDHTFDVGLVVATDVDLPIGSLGGEDPLIPAAIPAGSGGGAFRGSDGLLLFSVGIAALLAIASIPSLRMRLLGHAPLVRRTSGATGRPRAVTSPSSADLIQRPLWRNSSLFDGRGATDKAPIVQEERQSPGEGPASSGH
jgi:hypothetical protein